MYPVVKIKKERVASVKRRHPWIFSGAVMDYSHLKDGDIVEVQSSKGEFLAIAYFQDGSIMLRILSFTRVDIDEKFWETKINDAFSVREKIGFPDAATNAFRLFHGEGDGIPGLIIDIYKEVAVIQCHTIGIHKMVDQIKAAVIKNLPFIQAVFDKSKNALPNDYAEHVTEGFLYGSKEETEISENGNKFIIDFYDSQKTGFFLDQRDNRALVSGFSAGKKVLNLYCYTGGFSIYALNHDAEKVVSIDASKKALEMLERNVEITGRNADHQALAQDVNQYLSEIPADEFDIIIVDPPAFAKSVRKKHKAVQAYKRVNAAAIKKVTKGGMVFTFSCSQVIDSQLFYDTITAASIEAGRTCRVLYRMSQGADHPVNIFHPEGSYLKGLVLLID